MSTPRPSRPITPPKRYKTAATEVKRAPARPARVPLTIARRHLLSPSPRAESLTFLCRRRTARLSPAACLYVTNFSLGVPSLTSFVSQDIPGLPRPGDGQRFANAEVLITLLRLKTIPITGINIINSPRGSDGSCRMTCQHGAAYWKTSAKCPFTIHAQLEHGQLVLGPDSCYKHTHGPDKHIIEDPSWRPQIRGLQRYTDATEKAKACTSKYALTT